MSERNLTMMTDLYQLTMMYGHFMRNAKEEAVFDLFFRGSSTPTWRTMERIMLSTPLPTAWNTDDITMPTAANRKLTLISRSAMQPMLIISRRALRPR